jgi:DNA-directed RNA polymerase subunit omega
MTAQEKFWTSSPLWRIQIDLEEYKMLYPPVADLLKNVDSRYLLVNVVAHRARQIALEAETFKEDLSDKPVTLAIREVAEGKLTASIKDEYKN